MLILATAGAVNWIGWVVAMLILFIGFPLSIIRYRKRGPALGWMPRRWRGKTNLWYTHRGWDAPYDVQFSSEPTSVFTVITSRPGVLVTAFPGVG